MEVIIDANFGMALGPASGETLLEFSDSAVKKLKAIQADEGNPDLMLRVSVSNTPFRSKKKPSLPIKPSKKMALP
jgi:hypothetical protein